MNINYTILKVAINFSCRYNIHAKRRKGYSVKNEYRIQTFLRQILSSLRNAGLQVVLALSLF
jgi:hypothetical protein